MSGSQLVDITTTSVGRATLIDTYESFFARVRFSGRFRVVVTIDPAYGVQADELARVMDYLADLPGRHPIVESVDTERFTHQVGLSAALRVLFAMSTTEFGVHLEDDWRFTDDIDLDALIDDLDRFDSTEIVLTNSHVARGGTFTRTGEVERVVGSKSALLRLTSASWAANYLPLCPHLHRGRRWMPAVARALALSDDDACPDERVRELVAAERAASVHNVLWTEAVVAHDIGRAWLAARGRYRAITPESTATAATSLPRLGSGEALELTRSDQWRQRAEALIPGMTQTYLKRPLNFCEGEYPVYLERGSGAIVHDVDGNAYVDFVCALGAATLGHSHPVVTNTIRERVGRGVLPSLPSPSEVTAAERMVAAIPGVEMVRFLKTGADACSAAIRLARYVTGRDDIIGAGYHGWHDQLMCVGPGIPEGIARMCTRVALATEDDDERLVSTVERSGNRLAAVLLSTPYHRRLTREFLLRLRAACDATGALLVLDEVVTGFRLAPGGLGQFLDVPADLLCFSKGIAAGLPISALAGPAHRMRPLADLVVSTTFGGETLSLEVLKAVLGEYAAGDYYQRIARLGRRLRDGFNGCAAERGLDPVVVGYDPMPCLRFSPDPPTHQRVAARFVGAMARRGVLLRRDVNFINAAHTEAQVDHAVEAAGKVLGQIAVTSR
ncbi:aminotransferase class III-fold pyridoxal phosphate-dependent enzyme [Plantactinospora soyae]|uniref:Glutamate-1-semialdehyde aminotransferase n=1 Tax=Plantactinospora soyae TaxID=1544732 RepID=A0A927M834_9ACTN|nr:aminotransferase class III-fold pyridoxal phosphate-dependent enzyme [Plantactinospora soyae]MBE1489514.1 glutamate-1-semialdehyde aminotransferase [Plantactinospora soyae]